MTCIGQAQLRPYSGFFHVKPQLANSISMIFEKLMYWRRSGVGKNVLEMIADALPDG